MAKKKSFLWETFKSMFMGRRAGDALSIMEEEQVQSPGKTIMKEFFRRKLTIIGLIGFTVMFLASMIIPIFFPINLGDFNMDHMNEPPSNGMMRVPRNVRGNLSMVDTGPGWGVGVDFDNNIHSWGVMENMQIPLRTPPQVSSPIREISAGFLHALVVTEDGHIHSWGNENVVFRLNDVPPAIQGRVVTAKAGWRFSIALTDDNRLHTWGNMPDLTSISLARAPREGNIVSMDVNFMTAAVLTDLGNLYVLLPTSREFRYVPDEIQGRIVDFALSQNNGAAVLDDGTVVVWGGSDDVMNVPTEIQGRVVTVEGGNFHFTALLNDGTVASWGAVNLNQANVPRNVTGITSIAAGFNHSYALNAEGEHRAWGLNGFWLGTDHRGRDVFTRLWVAGRYSLLIGAISVFVSGFIGISLGALAGFYAGKIDMFIMRLGEAIGAIPFIPLAVILQWRFGNQFGQVGGMVFLMVVLGVMSWPSIMRLVRAQILQSREAEYVVAARALGVRQSKIIFKHIMPNIASIVIVQLTLALAAAMLIETTLSFIGFGVTEPIPTWGNMLTGSNDSSVLREFWWRWVFPAASLVTVAVSINLIGDGLREATDPKAQGR